MKKILMLGLVGSLLGSCSIYNTASNTQKKDVPGVEGKLVYHPDSIALQGKDNQLYFFFYDKENKCLFITKNKDLYQQISQYLPQYTIAGRYVILQGPSIDPFTLFSKEQLEQESQRTGIQLNQFKMYRIFNSGFQAPKGAPLSGYNKN